MFELVSYNQLTECLISMTTKCVRQTRHLKNKEPTRCQLLFHCASYRLNMFRALLSPPSGVRDYNVDYRIGRFVLGLQPTANQERNDQCGNQHYSRELLMMGITVPETC